MSDAKSRYEIIDGLTAQKTKLLDELSNLDDSVVKREQDIEQEKRNFVRQVDDAGREHERRIEDLKAQLESYRASVKERKTVLREKVEAYNDSIEAIKAVSSNQ